MNIVKRIEQKQTRLNRLYLQGSITKTELRDMLKGYARFVCQYFQD